MVHKMILTLFVAGFLLSATSAASIDPQNIENPEPKQPVAPESPAQEATVALTVPIEDRNSEVPPNPEGVVAPSEKSDGDLDTANTWWGGYYRRPYWGWGGYGGGYGGGWRRGWGGYGGYGGYGGWGGRSYGGYSPWGYGGWGRYWG